jgi:hypothetical protein
MEPKNEDRWISERLATLEPEWQADYARGRNLLDAGLAKPPRGRRWLAPAAVAAAVLIAALAIPQTRAFAQQLWYRVVLNRVDVVRLDLSDLPLETHVAVNGFTQAVRDHDEAQQKAGFRPSLPPAGTLRSNPSLTVTGPITVEQTIRVADLEAALRKQGANDLKIPPEWDGVHLRAEIGPTVTADYTDDVQILQTRPIELSVPSGFPLARLAEAAFRSLGVSQWESRALAQKFVANPGWFLDIPADETVHIQELSLRNGRALMIEDFDDEGRVWIAQRVTVIRSTADRIYAVSANDRQLALKVAEALP